MKIKAAVIREQNKPYTIEELELEPPKAREVLVRYAYTGYCHSDLSFLMGGMSFPLPIAAGHECAGIIEDVGPGVTKVKKGDHVIGTVTVPCGKCFQCLRGRGNLCTGNWQNFLEGMLLDGTARMKDKDGKTVRHFCYLSGFSSHNVVPEDAVIPIRKDLPLEHAALISCCVPTGWGSVTNIANVQPGDSVAVYGLGGIGLNILRAAVLRQANPVIAVDLEENRGSLAHEFGATHFICSAKEDPVPKIQELTMGGAEFVFEAIGDPGAIIQAWWSTGMNGKLVIPGLTHPDKTTNLPLMLLPLHQKSILGSAYGGVCPSIDFPRLVDLAMRQDLKLDKLVTKKFKVEQINDVAEAMRKRQIRGRWVCDWE